MVRPPSTASVSCTRQALVQPVGVHAPPARRARRPRVSAVSSAARCAPRSSCTLKPHAPPAASASSSGSGREDEPRARKPTLTGHASNAANAVRSAPGRVDAHAPDRAELLADHRRHAGGQRRLQDARGQQVHVGVDRARRGDQPLAGDDRRAGADHHVDAVHACRGCRPGRWRAIRPARMPMAVLRTPEHRVEHQHVGDHDVAGLVRRPRARCMPSRAVLPKPVQHSSPAAARRASTRRPGRCRPSAIRSPVVGPYTSA